MSYQKCPVCNGSGIQSHPLTLQFNKSATKCSVCNGKKIISTVTGRPPMTRREINTERYLNTQNPKYIAGIDPYEKDGGSSLSMFDIMSNGVFRQIKDKPDSKWFEAMYLNYPKHNV